MVSKKDPTQTPSKNGEDAGLVSALRKNPWVEPLLRAEVLALLLFILTFTVRYAEVSFRAADNENFRSLALAQDMVRGDYFKGGFNLDDGVLGARRLPPLYPALIAAYNLAGADPERAGTWISLVAGSLAVVPLFFLGGWIGHRGTGLMAGLLYCFLPAALATASSIGPGQLLVLLTVTTLWLLARFLDQPSLGKLALAAIAAALAALTQEIGMAYPILLLLALAVAGKNLGWDRRHTIMCLAPVMGVTILALAPYLIWVRLQAGQFQLSPRPGGIAGLLANRGPGPGLGQLAELLPAPVAVLALLGLALWPAGPRGRLAREFPLWLWACAVLAAGPFAAAADPDAGPYLPAAVLGCLWAGRAMSHAPDLAEKKIPGPAGPILKLAVIALLAGIMGFHLQAGVAQVKKQQWFNSDENWKTVPAAGRREAAQDMVRLLKIKPGALILSADPLFAYYLEGRHRPLAATEAEVKSQLAAGNVDYLVIDSFAVQQVRPGLKGLITATDPVAGAGLVFRRYYPDTDRLISVYQPNAGPISPAPKDPGPDHIPGLLEQGRKYLDQGYLEHSRQLMLAILSLDPDNAAAHFQLMLVYLHYGAYDEKSLDLAADELMRYSFQAIDDPDVARYRELIQQVRIQHRFIWGEK